MVLKSDQYSWNDISIVIGGRVLTGITSVEVEYGWEHEKYFGKGGKAQGINEKNFECSGTIKLLQSEVEALEDTYGVDLQRQYFDIIWNFTGKNDVAPRSHNVKYAKFGKIKKGIKQGDAFMEIDVPFMALDFKPNV